MGYWAEDRTVFHRLKSKGIRLQSAKLPRTHPRCLTSPPIRTAGLPFITVIMCHGILKRSAKLSHPIATSRAHPSPSLQQRTSSRSPQASAAASLPRFRASHKPETRYRTVKPIRAVISDSTRGIAALQPRSEIDRLPQLGIGPAHYRNAACICKRGLVVPYVERCSS